MPAPYHRLRIKSLKFISAVDAGAQGPIANVALLKCAPGGESVEATCKVIKTDEKLGLVFGWALASSLDGGKTPHVDLQDDAIVGDDELIKAAAAFMESGAAADVLHDENVDGKIVFCMPLTKQVNDALGIKSDVHGLAIAMKPSPETFARFVNKELNAFSIGGIGERELVTKSVWSTADIDSLPDSSFLYVEPGGKTDSDGKTTPRSLRHFPYRDSSGKVDLDHLRNAIARIPQSSLAKDLRDKLQVKAERLLADQHDKASKRLRKQAVLTSTVDGHAHTIDLDDPCDEWRDQLSTSYQTSEGATQSHCHAWTFDPDTGEITIAADSGHTHTTDAVVPDDVRAEAAANEDGERCRNCNAMCDESDRYCPCCGKPMGSMPAAACEPVSDGGDRSGPTVVVVNARAPGGATTAAKSSPSSAAHSVGDTQEPNQMPELNDRIRELEAANARLEKMATLTDAQRAHFAKLRGGDADNFLSMTASQRELILVDLEKADEVVYTAADGTKYRKSQPVEIINAAKATDGMNATLADLKKREQDFEFKKRGETLFANIAKGARGDIPMRLMRAIENEFVKADERDEVLKAMKQYEAALVTLSKTAGYSASLSTDEPQTAQAKLDALAANYAKANNVPLRKAAVAVLETAEGAALYAQLPTGRA